MSEIESVDVAPDLFGNRVIASCKQCGVQGRRMIVNPNKYSECRGMCYKCAHAVHAKLGYNRSERGVALALKHNMKRLYGITMAEFDEMRRRQDYRCAICGCHEDSLRAKLHKGRPGRLCVDHCHTTGKIRGLLCKRCNTMLGQAQESAEIMLAAMAYLERTAIETGKVTG